MKQSIVPAGFEATYSEWRFSPGVRAGDFLVVSGQVGLGTDGTAPREAFAEARIVFENIKAVLAAAGAVSADVIDILSFHTDLRGDLAAFAAAKDEYFSADYPAWTAIGVNQLALEGLRFEVKATALLSDRTAGR